MAAVVSAARAVRASDAIPVREGDQQAEAIYASARTAWAAMHYPADLSYQITIEATVDGHVMRDEYDGEVLPASSDCRVQAFSHHEQQHPNVPHGIDVVATLSISPASKAVGAGPLAPIATTIQVNSPIPFTDIIGVPRFGPTYSFGMRGRRLTAPAPEATDAAPIIGRIAATQRKYALSFVGDEQTAGVDTAHVRFVPLLDPQRYRLRDAWIERSSYRLVRLRVAGNFTRGPEAEVPWLIDFSQIDGATYIEREIAEAPFKRRRRTLRDVTIRFSHIAPRTALRPLGFDLGRHRDVVDGLDEPSDAADPNLGC